MHSFIRRAWASHKARRFKVQVAAKPDAIAVALQALGSDGWQVRQLAIENLIDLSTELTSDARKTLIDSLIGEVEQPRTIGARSAAQEVLTHIGREIVPSVLERVERRGPGCRLLVDLVAFLGRESDVPRLKVIYEAASDDQNLRAAIASVLGAIGGEQACAALHDMLDEPEPHLRVFALDGLRMARSPVDPQRLEALAVDPLTRKAAVSMLGYSQNSVSIRALVCFLCDKVRGVRAAALVGIGGLLAWAKSLDSDEQRTLVYEELSDLSQDARGQLEQLAAQGDREVLCAALDVGQVCVHVPLLGVAVEQMDDGSVYERAISLASICGESTLEFFESWLGDPVKTAVMEPVYRLAAMSGVQELNARWTEYLLLQVQGGQEDLASAACEVLGKCAGPDTIAALVPFCKEDGPLGEHVADALANLLQRHRLTVRSLLTDHARLEPTWSSERIQGPFARNLCRIIGKVGDPDVHGFLEAVLSCSDVEARISAIVALGRVQSQARTESLLRMALADEDAQARAAACRSLARLGLCRAEAGLVSATRDISAFVRAAAVQSLVKLNCRRARSRMIEMIDGKDSPAVLVYAIEGLGKWCEPEDQARLLRLTHDSDFEIVKAAIRGLDLYLVDEVSDSIEALLSHERWDVRWVCAEALKDRKAPRSRSALERALSREHDPLVQETLVAALGVLDGPGARG